MHENKKPQGSPLTELRCGGTMHGKLSNGLLEVKCKRRICGAGPSVVVLHTFDLTTGKMVNTQRFQNPSLTQEGNKTHGNGC